VNESGLTGFEFNSWFAVMAPAGTPKAIITQLHSEVVKALSDTDVQTKLIQQGLTPRGLAPDDLGKAMRIQYAKYGKLIKDAGIKSE
jgi:tripartite-type tricarboxylate transporter receptor subunit TctC